MLRKITLAGALLLAATVSYASIWPEEYFGYKRTSMREVTLGESPIWEEYGFEEGESAEYELSGDRFQATAYRFHDATSAMAVYHWKRPVEARKSELTELAVEWSDGVFLAFGNYIFRFEGRKPSEEELVGMLLILPMLEQSPLPTFPEFFPATGLVPGSTRFVIGPASLQEFEPRIPPSTAGFHFGVEAQLAKFRSPKGDIDLGVFSYPTPHIARERLAEFRMLPNAVVRRSGPLLAVVLDSPDPDEAQRLVSLVNYRATIVWDEFTAAREPTIVDIVLTAFMFIGGLLVLAILFGGVFGGAKFLWWRRSGAERDPMILLHIDDK